MAEEKIINWGIMGPGGISDKFATELARLKDGRLAAVAGRTPEKTQTFAAKFGAPRTYGSCEELAADPDIDIVYVGTLHPIHHENVITLLKGGKAVLCEKPFTMNAQEAADIAALAKERGLFVMEAMWTRFLPAIIQVREWLAEGRIGDVRLLKAEFGFDAGWNPEGRLLNPKLGGGTLLDAGIYPISFASMVFGAQPEKIQSSAVIGETGVDEQFSVLFDYAGGAMASLHGAIRLRMNNDAWIYGTKGKIHIPSFLAASEATLFANDGDPVVFKHERVGTGHNLQAVEAMNCLRAGLKESPAMPLDETVRLMETLDRIRAQWGLTYDGK